MADQFRVRDSKRFCRRLPAGTAFVVLVGVVLLGGPADPALGPGPTPCAAATVWLTGPAGATVTVDGTPMGSFPLAGPLTLSPGRYLVQSRMDGRLPYEATINLESDEVRLRLQVRLIPLKLKTAITSNLLLAGLGQHYLGKKTKGWIFNAAELGGLLAALSGELSLQNDRDEYLLLVDKYEGAISDADIALYSEQVREYSQKMKDSESMRDTGLMVAAGAVVLSILDAWLAFPSFAAGAGTVPVSVGSAHPPDLPVAVGGTAPADLGAVHAGWRARF